MPRRPSLGDVQEDSESGNSVEAPYAPVLIPTQLPESTAKSISAPSTLGLDQPTSPREGTTRPDSRLGTFNSIARWHKLVFGFSCLGQCLGIALFVAFFASGSFFQREDRGARWTYSGASKHTSLNTNLWRSLQKDTSNDFLGSKVPPQLERSTPSHDFELILDSTSTCLSRSNLVQLQNLEIQLFNATGYRTSVCHMVDTATCARPVSVLRLFDGTYAYLNVSSESNQNIFRPDLGFDRVEEILSVAFQGTGNALLPSLQAANQPFLRDIINYVVDKGYEGGTPNAKRCRMKFPTGLPLPGFQSAVDRPEEQLERVGAWFKNTWHSMLEDKTIADMSISYTNSDMASLLLEDEFDRVATWLWFSFGVFFLTMAAGTRSIALAVVGSIQIVGSYAWAVLLYRYLGGIQLFGLPQLLATLVAGTLGCTSTLVLAHAAQRLLGRAENMRSMGALLYKTLVPHCFIIGLTTTFAFALSAVATQVDEVLALANLCAFIALTTMLSALTFNLSAILFWIKLLNLLDNANHRATSSLGNCLSKLVFTRVVGHRAVRWLVVAALTVVVVAFMTTTVVNVTVDQQQPQLWRSTSPLQSFREDRAHFATTNTSTSVNLVFGVSGTLEECPYPAHNRGCIDRPDYQQSWEPSFGTIQAALLNICTMLRTVNETRAQTLKFGRTARIDPMTNAGDLLLDCPMEDLALHVRNKALQFPVETGYTEAVLPAQPTIFPPQAYRSAAPFAGANATWYRYFEVAVLDWLLQNNTGGPGDHFARFSGLVNGRGDSTRRQAANGTLAYAGAYGDTLRFMAIRMQLALDYEDLDVGVGKEAFAAWQQLTTDMKATLPPSSNAIFLSSGSDRTWEWLFVQESLLTATWSSILIGSMVGFLVLAAGTKNWAGSLTVLLTTGLVIIMVFGVYSLLDWNLDLNVATNSVLLAPLSFNVLSRLVYVYLFATPQDRDGRVLAALSGAGEPVLFSCVGSFLAVCFIFITEDFYAFHFGVTYMATMGLLLVFSLVYLMAVLDIFGPERQEGTLRLHSARQDTDAPATAAEQEQAMLGEVDV